MTDIPEATTKFVLSRGSYSDYRVLAVCDTEERAKNAAKAINADKNRWDEVMVEEILYLDRDPVRITVFKVTENLWDNGSTSHYNDFGFTEWEFDLSHDADRQPARWRWIRAPMHERRGGRLEVTGTDHELVLKTFAERKAMLQNDDALRAQVEIKSPPPKPKDRP